MIQHTVIFNLHGPKGSEDEKKFFKAAALLAGIPGVNEFELWRQVSKKNKFDFGISMEFTSQKAYDYYSNHRDHSQFIEDYWLRYVKDFLEIDFEKLI